MISLITCERTVSDRLQDGWIDSRLPYLEFPRGLVHLVEAQVGHEEGQGVLGLLAHLSVAVLQTGVQGGQAQREVRGPPAQSGQALRQPAQQLEGKDYIQYSTPDGRGTI